MLHGIVNSRDCTRFPTGVVKCVRNTYKNKAADNMEIVFFTGLQDSGRVEA